jgi:hypothetical protein
MGTWTLVLGVFTGVDPGKVVMGMIGLSASFGLLIFLPK